MASKVGLAAALVGVGLSMGGCEAFWRQVDANVVELHQDKVNYMAEFREEEAKLRQVVEATEAAKSPPDVQLKAIGSYLRSAQAYREGLNRSLRFVRENGKQIARCGLTGLDEAGLAKELAEQKARADAMLARAMQLRAQVAPEGAATGSARP